MSTMDVRNVWSTSPRGRFVYTTPYCLAQRFGIRCGSPFPTDCAETRRLAFLASRLRTQGTPIESWKLLLATGEREIASPGITSRGD